ncbi:MAG TPA: class I SAM-dependent methyltransferase [Reyranella sp.]|nr:class I SAM-dependent methyltransferase [Reyranella sp.]
MLSWEKIDAIPGWFGFGSYCIWRALLDQQTRMGATGDFFEIGVWKGRSASVLANYRKGREKIYLCDIKMDEPAIQTAIRSTGIEPANLVPIETSSADLASRLDLRTMHRSVRWVHIDGEHTGPAVYRELELANRIANDDGLVVIDDFFSERYPANTTEAIRYLEKNPFHFRFLAVGYNKAYFCRPEALPKYMEFMSSGMAEALLKYGAPSTIFKTTGPWDTDAVGIVAYLDGVGPVAGADNEPYRWDMIRTKHVWGPLRVLHLKILKLMGLR